MKHLFIASLVCLLTANLSAQEWVGSWEGDLNAGMQTVKIIFNIKKGADGELTATMDSPDQNAYDLKMDEVSTRKGSITMEMKSARIKYIGEISEDGQKMKGDWIQGVTLELNLTKAKGGEKHPRPQTPQAPFPYKIEDITYPNEKAKINLAGTVTIPKEGDKHPVAILISGSGPQDRDESILKHKPFWVIADYLTRNGIAVLRFDDRGFGKSEGDFTTATTADFATDVEAAVAYLRTQDWVDQSKIGLIGHSEGGMVAPMVASKDKKIAFMVLLAGPGVPCAEVLAQQGDDILKEKGVDEEVRKHVHKINTTIYGMVAKDKKNTLAVGDLVDAVKDDVAKIDASLHQELGLDKLSLRKGCATAKTSWMRYFLSYVPETNLKKVKCPVLALNGEKDIQVAAKTNLDAIKKALKKNKKATIQALPNLNHLFQTCETGAFDEYIEIEETFAPDALKIMLDWLKKV